MKRISGAAKEAIIEKALRRNGQNLGLIAQENNIGLSTLNKWLRGFKSSNTIDTDHNRKSGGVKSDVLAARFKHLLATYGQDTVMVGAYCRKNGLYPHQLIEWEADFMKTSSTPVFEINAELKELRTEVKTLKKIIMRKDKVLAETVALLVLKKKVAQIWGDNGED